MTYHNNELLEILVESDVSYQMVGSGEEINLVEMGKNTYKITAKNLPLYLDLVETDEDAKKAALKKWNAELKKAKEQWLEAGIRDEKDIEKAIAAFNATKSKQRYFRSFSNRDQLPFSRVEVIKSLGLAPTQESIRQKDQAESLVAILRAMGIKISEDGTVNLKK